MARLDRTRSPRAPARPLRLPGDVRLMNIVTALVVTGCVFALAAAGVLWLTRAPGFTLRSIEVKGELTRNPLPTLRTHALPELAGNFFSIDLDAARKAFEAVPWVRRAIVRRIWPDRLVVQLEEHEALALWEANEGSQTGFTRLVNTFGEVFEANLADVEDEALPLFTGPEGRAAEMLALWKRLAPAFAERAQRIEQLSMSGRGSWRAELGRGVVVEMGRGSEAEVAERVLRTVGAMTAKYRQPYLYADLRHADGYALKLRGVGTGGAASGPAGARTN
jgi:cell division protein FtsQ